MSFSPSLKPCAAEKLPYEKARFHFALMVTTICFIDDPEASLGEIRRILRPRGELIVAFVDKNSPVGQRYLAEKDQSLFYREARFFSGEEMEVLMTQNGFFIEQVWQTVFGPLQGIQAVQEPERGYGKGSFIVMKTRKSEEGPLSR